MQIGGHVTSGITVVSASQTHTALAQTVGGANCCKTSLHLVAVTVGAWGSGWWGQMYRKKEVAGQ